MTPDLELALRLADAADAISALHFGIDDLAVEFKRDGSPVTEVDPAVENAMASIVRVERPDDALLGEEIGASGSGPRRWIFDGIDGTHNYAVGRPMWGTMIGLEVDGEVEVGVVSSPGMGKRWYAARGCGSWEIESGSAAPPRRLQCSTTADLEQATVSVAPLAGMLAGWRSDAADVLRRGEPIVTRSFAITGVYIASGLMDASVTFMAGIWDIAAVAVIVEEAGGRFSDVWGGRALDTTTSVLSNGHLGAQLLAIAAPHLPAEPDEVVWINRPPMPTRAS